MRQAARDIFEQLDNYIGGVPAERVPEIWGKVSPILQRVVKPHTGYSLDAVMTKLMLSHWQLWVINDFQAVAVTEIQVRPLHKVLWCQFIVGDHVDDWLSDWEKVQAEYARQHDCMAVEFSGRPGWHKFKGKYPDYKPVLTTYRKEL